MRMHYNDLMFKAVRDSDWSARHIAAHDVTLDEVREAILERPYWSVPDETARRWSTARPTRAAISWWWQSTKAARRSS
jgi:hypothetical protein